jgi:multidrug efflux system membrane fusion protein
MARCLMAFAALSWLALAGCERRHGPDPNLAARPPSQTNLKRSVVLAQAQRQELEYFVETVGTLEAEAETNLAAGVTGIVDEVNFREGDDVTPETVLVRVDQRRYQSSADSARASEKRAAAALALARDAADRAREARRGASEEEVTRALLNLRAAEAELHAAQAARALAEHYLDRSQVRAPYAGRINKRLVTPGAYVDEKFTIATLADLSRLRLVSFVPETAAATVRNRLQERESRALVLRLASLALASPRPFRNLAEPVAEQILTQRLLVPADVEFTVRALPDRKFRASIFYMSTVANPDTHMFECKAEVPLVLGGVRLQPGYSATIRFPLRTNPDACIIPEEAVRPTERGFVCFVPRERQGRGGTEWVAEARVLILGSRANGKVEVRGGEEAGKGLRPGDWYILKGAQALEDGTPIQFAQTSLAAPPRERAAAGN